MLKRHKFIPFILSVFIMGSGCFHLGYPSSASAQTSQPRSPEPYYQGKTVTIIVPSSPGGAIDVLARLIIRYMPKYIPGNPVMIVNNIAGGAQLIGTRAIYTAKPDGLTLGHFSSAIILSEVLGLVKGMSVSKFEWLGSAEGSVYTFFIRSDLPYRTVDDLRQARQPIKVGDSGRTTLHSGLVMPMLKMLLGSNLHIIRGYKGFADIMLAVQGRELDGEAAPTLSYYSQATLKDMYDSRFIRPVLHVGGRPPVEKDEKIVKGLPYVADHIRKPEDKEIYDMSMDLIKMARVFSAPPGTPPAYLEILRQALAKTVVDPEFVAGAAKAGFEPYYADHRALEKFMAKFTKVPKKFMDMINIP